MKASKLNRFKSRREWSDYVWRRLLKDIRNPALSAAIDSLLSSYEKNIIINRFAAVTLIKDGQTYREIGRELWLSPNTVRCLKRVLENSSIKEYQSHRLRSNKRKQAHRIRELERAKKEISFQSDFLDWADYCISVMPAKTGPRWKWFK